MSAAAPTTGEAEVEKYGVPVIDQDALSKLTDQYNRTADALAETRRLIAEAEAEVARQRTRASALERDLGVCRDELEDALKAVLVQRFPGEKR